MTAEVVGFWLVAVVLVAGSLGVVLTPNLFHAAVLYLPTALVATGFLAAGPWDESGLRDINEQSLDRQVARYLDRDDVVTSVMSAFAGLTVHCARCHDHKFDPVSQADYYALQAVFAGIDKAERAYDADPAVASKRAALAAEFSHPLDDQELLHLINAVLMLEEEAVVPKAWIDEHAGREGAEEYVRRLADRLAESRGQTVESTP